MIKNLFTIQSSFKSSSVAYTKCRVNSIKCRISATQSTITLFFAKTHSLFVRTIKKRASHTMNEALQYNELYYLRLGTYLKSKKLCASAFPNCYLFNASLRGIFLKRLPVRANTAFPIAAPIGPIGGSPTPEGLSPLSKIITSISLGASFIVAIL